jgi:hypothetical protein
MNDPSALIFGAAQLYHRPMAKNVPLTSMFCAISNLFKPAPTSKPLPIKLTRMAVKRVNGKSG